MTAPSWRAVEREIARARSARRAAPWVLLGALGTAALVAVAGRNVSGALPVLLPGLAAALFAWWMGIARCPVCGRRLEEGGRARPVGAAGPPAIERTHRCPRCGARFE